MPARLDRIIELQRRTVTRGDFGDEVESWSEIDKVWANVKQTGVSEDFENDANRDVALRKRNNPHRLAGRRHRDRAGDL